MHDQLWSRPQGTRFNSAFDQARKLGLEAFKVVCFRLFPKFDFMSARFEVYAGVAYELGYAKALGKPIVGLKTDYLTFQEWET